ncbi:MULTISPECIES: helix-turn-helix domain-containing protein [Agrobacterium]|uniref:helix-turn-helix domain-containing protein n=1 Tax=Agrobacterium tumefaciens TaxID=358 RepID=UPI00122FDABB|nr:XRE family transcriptional regulator [Agrobacterium tumefaciens]NSY05767.1 helix-turn-helix transcriptional regulator [Agrobacterium tumefaciens]NSZ05613.1 helix-turn-helix transcriptional regulator [Agrobacterium tumefaciens]
MNATQLKMARVGLGWGVRDLAEKAGITANTVTRIENGSDAKTSTVHLLQTALEIGEEIEPGKWRFAEFIEPGGVRIRLGGDPDAERGAVVHKPI